MAETPNLAQITRDTEIFFGIQKNVGELLRPGKISKESQIDALRALDEMSESIARLWGAAEHFKLQRDDILTFSTFQTYIGQLKTWIKSRDKFGPSLKALKFPSGGEAESSLMVALSALGRAVEGKEGGDNEWKTAPWFKQETGIDSAKLRMAASRGKLPKRGTGKQTEYHVLTAMRLWPEDFAGLKAQQNP